MGIKKGLTHAPEEMKELKEITLSKNFVSGNGKEKKIQDFQTKNRHPQRFIFIPRDYPYIRLPNTRQRFTRNSRNVYPELEERVVLGVVLGVVLRYLSARLVLEVRVVLGNPYTTRQNKPIITKKRAKPCFFIRNFNCKNVQLIN